MNAYALRALPIRYCRNPIIDSYSVNCAGTINLWAQLCRGLAATLVALYLLVKASALLWLATVMAVHCTAQCNGYCTVYTTHCTLHSVHYTLHTTHFKLHTAHYTLHIVHCTLLSVCQREDLGSIKYPLFTQRLRDLAMYSVHIYTYTAYTYSVHIYIYTVYTYSVHIYNYIYIHLYIVHI